MDRGLVHAALHDAGAAAGLRGRLDEAKAALLAALSVDPQNARSRHALALVLLRQGRYSEAWPLYEERFEVAELGISRPALPYPEWRGEPLSGKRLLIFPEQGFGDQIMFARFARLAAQVGADVTLICSPPLARLFESLGVRVIAAAGSVEFPDPDYWVMSSSIAGRFRTTPETVPPPPYLTAAPRDSRSRIGVMWRGNPTLPNDANRSLTQGLGQRLLNLPGAMSLAPEDTGARDFLDTAEIVASLDLVISVDTAVAHLAGALGKPLWVLLPHYGQDWRWGDRQHSPWYPHARLFRQPEPGDWDSVIARVVQETVNVPDDVKV